MSRASAQPAKRVEIGHAKPGDVLVLDGRDTWIATRFGLPRWPSAQMRWALRAQMLARGGYRYRLSGLNGEALQRLLAVLAGHAQHDPEAWR